MSKRFTLSAVFCAAALAAAGCGSDDEDNQALSYEETGAEIGRICDSVNTDEAGLTGEVKNDAERLGPVVNDFESAVEEVRGLEVNEELQDERDAFVENAEQQLDLVREARDLAQEGDQKAYEEQLEQTETLDEASDVIASQLGAAGCLDD